MHAISVSPFIFRTRIFNCDPDFVARTAFPRRDNMCCSVTPIQSITFVRANASAFAFLAFALAVAAV